MSRDEVVQNIGTIAKSGTREFLQSLSGDQAKDARLIGQFGVGFYSAFIVADRVTLISRRAGLPASEGVRWECDMDKSAGQYSIERIEKTARGTDVILHLREGEDELLDEFRLKAIIRKYSDHIAIPIVMGDESVNQASALWARPKQEIVTHSVTNMGIRIPAGAGDHPQEASYTFAHDAQILSLLPHMHVRGKAFKYVAVAPDGKEEVLLDVPHYDFNWQTCYSLKEPKVVKRGTTIHAYARFDNSKENPFNPDTTKDVRWGQQTWEEMLVGYMDYVKTE
jgi:hypothetical protein